MADGFTIEIEPGLAERLKARADEIGMSPVDLVRDAIEQHLLTPDDYDWSEGFDPDPAIDERIAEETIRDGDGVPLAEALSQFRAELERKLADRA